MGIPKIDMTLDKAIFFHANEPCVTSLHQLVPEKKILKECPNINCHYGATLIGATLIGATLIGATLIGATLIGATLIGATLIGNFFDDPFLK